MRTYALLDENNIVINISLSDENWDSTGWIEYTDSNPAIIGGDYYQGLFYPPKPFDSWIRDNGNWKAPKPKPNGESVYYWDEKIQNWVEF